MADISKINLKRNYLTKVFITIVILWLVLSSMFLPLMISLGILSALVTTYILFIMNVFNSKDAAVSINLVKMTAYIFWLFKEIIISNFKVCWLILKPQYKITPIIGETKSELSTDFTTTIYANSITLTPGTITIDINDNVLTVHSLDEKFKTSLDSRVMYEKVKSTEISKELK